MRRFAVIAAVLALPASFATLPFPGRALAQTDANMTAFNGLAAQSVLDATPAGQAALAANLKVTGAIQDGSSGQPALQSFADQQQQALRDTVSNLRNGHQLADGMGTRLGGAYQAIAVWSSPDDGKTVNAADISPAVARVIAYANDASYSDSSTSKTFLGDGAMPRGVKASDAAAAIFMARKSRPDVFGRAYDLPAGSLGASPFGNARPFATEPHLLTFRGKNISGQATNSIAYLVGPAQDLRGNPSFPSGHTTYGYVEGVLLGILAPARYPEMVARAAEYGNSRIVLGAHYAMDVLGGRTLALHDLAMLLANKPGYAGVEHNKVKIDDFRKAVMAARADMDKALEAGCGAKIPVCARDDRGRFADAAKVEAFYESTQTYGIPAVYADRASPVDFAKVAPEAGYLLTAAFPRLSLKDADAILTATQGPGGGFLDDGSAFGVYSRIDLYRAARQAMVR